MLSRTNWLRFLVSSKLGVPGGEGNGGKKSPPSREAVGTTIHHHNKAPPLADIVYLRSGHFLEDTYRCEVRGAKKITNRNARRTLIVNAPLLRLASFDVQNSRFSCQSSASTASFSNCSPTPAARPIRFVLVHTATWCIMSATPMNNRSARVSPGIPNGIE